MNLADFGALTRALPEPHLLVDATGTVLAANGAAVRFFGGSPGSLIGVSLASLVRTPESKLLDFLANAAASGQLIPGRLDVGSDGDPRSVPVGAGVVRPARGPDPAILLLRIDNADQGNPFLLLTRKIDELSTEVRRRMALEEERSRLLRSEQEARAYAEEASRLKDDFLATLSHELRTPLNAILGWSSMLRAGEVAPDKQALALRTIERSARAQSQLVEDLLDFSRIIGGQVRLDVRPVDLSEVIEAAIETVRPAAEAKGIRLDVVVDPRAGPVSGDPDRLQQVAWNLLTNAIKFSERHGRVQVRVERVNSHIEIVVSDHGEGIAAEFLPHVFDRFRQADSSRTRAHGGLGLGLSITRHLVEAHAGVIHAASDGPGTGATFTVMLPLRVDQRALALAGDRSHPAAELETAAGERLPPDALRDLDILVLEDHEESRVILTTLLEQRGAHVRLASAAEEARRHIDERVPDVVLADIELPGEDGYTFIRKLRAEPTDRGGTVPAIAVSAFARRVDRVRALEAGFQMHMPKPVDPAELVTTIRAVLRGS